MLRVRIPPELSKVNRPSWSSLEGLPPCRGGGRGVESRRGRSIDRTRGAVPRRPRRGRRPSVPHEDGSPGSTPGPGTCRAAIRPLNATEARYANRQSGRVESPVPVGSTPTRAISSSSIRPVVQRLRLLSYKQARGVRFPPGRLGEARPGLAAMGGWSNGKTPGLHPGDRGSIPRPVHWSAITTEDSRKRLARLLSRRGGANLPQSALRSRTQDAWKGHPIGEGDALGERAGPNGLAGSALAPSA